MPRLAASTISIRSTFAADVALQLVDRAARLVGDSLAVDQDIFGRLAEAAFAVSAVRMVKLGTWTSMS